MALRIEEKNPLKQGLKPEHLFFICDHAIIEEKNPLKQGLKHDAYRIAKAKQEYWREESIKTRIETKAGPVLAHASEIEEKNPLKQGLKRVRLYILIMSAFIE